jgi:glycosyltransferase involved in cell wall biosynthesis
VKILVLPRDANPYQESLYGAMDPGAVEVRYLDGPTRSQTANLLALPFLLVWFRARGFRLLHIHWVHPFLVSWARGDRTRGLVQRGYELFLALAVALGYRIVWTAHNVLPHVPVFRDDVAARRVLLDRSDAVIVHSRHTAGELERWGTARVVVVPQGADRRPAAGGAARDDARRTLGLDPTRPVVLFFGNVLPYKGIDVLLDAVADLPAGVAIDVIVIGRCPERRLQDDLEARASRAGSRVRTRFAFVPDAELAVYLAAADFAVFPFRAVTNSSSVATALGAGLPVIAPRLDTLGDLPDDAVLRYEPGAVGLTAALVRAAGLEPTARARLAAAAERFAAQRTWSAAAEATRQVYADVLRQCAPEGQAAPSAREHDPVVVSQ